jgi:D-amino-acid dehydrogenase
MNNKVVIIGGGIIGLCSAYYLHQQGGWDITIVDKGLLEDNCSFGNAGMIVPSHFVPLAAPGMVQQGIRWMFDSKSPFYVRPSLNMDLISWGLKFLKSANKKHVEQSAVPLRDLSLLSKQLYRELAANKDFNFGLTNNGILMLYRSQKAGDEESHLAEKARELGLDAVPLTPQECQALQPDIKVDVSGAVHYRCDAHLTPGTLVKQLINYLETAGVKIYRSNEVIRIENKGDKITKVCSKTHEWDAGQVIIAGGAWSPEIVKLTGLKLPLMPGKGYSFMFDEPAKRMSIPALLTEAKVSVTPMGDQIRFGGTMEIGAASHKINMNRVRGIVESIPRYFPDFKPVLPDKSAIWHGFRPCSPDGMPYIGRMKKFTNLVIAGGHGMMGLSLGPATGKLVSELISEIPVSMPVEAFSPERYL